ncbi:unnamed protein product [Ectocarpus sp. 12 AP-2014]
MGDGRVLRLGNIWTEPACQGLDGDLAAIAPPRRGPQSFQGLDTIARCTLLTKGGQERMLMIGCRRCVSNICADQGLDIGVIPRPFLVRHRIKHGSWLCHLSPSPWLEHT